MSSTTPRLAFLVPAATDHADENIYYDNNIAILETEVPAIFVTPLPATANYGGQIRATNDQSISYVTTALNSSGTLAISKAAGAGDWVYCSEPLTPLDSLMPNAPIFPSYIDGPYVSFGSSAVSTSFVASIQIPAKAVVDVTMLCSVSGSGPGSSRFAGFIQYVADLGSTSVVPPQAGTHNFTGLLNSASINNGSYQFVSSFGEGLTTTGMFTATNAFSYPVYLNIAMYPVAGNGGASFGSMAYSDSDINSEIFIEQVGWSP